MKLKRYVSGLAACAGALLVIIGCLGCSGGKSTSDKGNVGGIPTTGESVTTEGPKRGKNHHCGKGRRWESERTNLQWWYSHYK